MWISARFVLMVYDLVLWFDWAMLPVPARIRRVLDGLAVMAKAAIDPAFARQLRSMQTVANVVGGVLEVGAGMLMSWLERNGLDKPKNADLSDLDAAGLKERLRRSVADELGRHRS